MEHNINGDIMNNTNYYKGYDISSKDRLEKIKMEFENPYGYNLESNSRKVVNLEYNATHTNQNFVKNREYLGKR